MKKDSKSKIIILSLICIFQLFCADKPSFIQSGSGYLGHSSTQTSFFSGSPGSWGESFYNNVAALGRTVKNALSDDEAFILLGWPTTNIKAREEMKRVLYIYSQILIETDQQKRQEYLQTIVNRTTYLLRAYNALPNRSDGVALAEYCIKNHLPAMNEALLRLFKMYSEKKAREATRAMMNVQHSLLPINNQSMKTTAVSTVDQNVDSHVNNNIATILLKIGWSVSNNESKAPVYLNKCLNVYKIKKALGIHGGFQLLQTVEGRASLDITEGKTTEKMINDFKACKFFVALREKWMRKIYEFLPECIDGLKLAWFCLKSHDYVMPLSLQEDYHAFIQNKQREYADIFNEVENMSG